VSSFAPGSQASPIRAFDVLAGLSLALDLAEGQRSGHTMRATLLAMALADRFDLPLGERRDVYLASLVRDLGGTACAALLHAGMGVDDRLARRGLKLVDWTHASRAARAAGEPGRSWLRAAAFDRPDRVARLLEHAARLRSERGAAIADGLGLGPGVTCILRAADEHWDGSGLPARMRAAQIPMGARIALLADVVEAHLGAAGPDGALAMAHGRAGRWFDPALVRGLNGLERELARWHDLSDDALVDAVRAAEPPGGSLLAGPAMLDRIAGAYGGVVDAKSPWTLGHSARVAYLAALIAREMELPEEECAGLRRAAMLHDLGKLSLPNALLEKPGPLSAEQWERVRLYPWHTGRILARVPGLQPLAEAAAAHHERLDGRGYPFGLRGRDIPRVARILAIADGFEALTADRPYRPALPDETALRLLARDRGIGVDADVLAALSDALGHVTPGEPFRAA
jgi:HD-GYP domain-containing protein (c-di-GMP phosphodiesterase class II)